jgi:hypothetical protein
MSHKHGEPSSRKKWLGNKQGWRTSGARDASGRTVEVMDDLLRYLGAAVLIVAVVAGGTIATAHIRWWIWGDRR